MNLTLSIFFHQAFFLLNLLAYMSIGFSICSKYAQIL